jgi:arylsulfatase A-like enzyme
MTTRPPNVIYILSDDQRAELLGCAGHPVLQTPNLDALAAQGVRFTEARCTSALCTPSRVSHYTGQWERKHGVNFNSQTSLSEAAWEKGFVGRLKQAGYQTAWIGKNHVPAGNGGYDSGYFEHWFDCWYGNHNHSGFYPAEMARGGSLYTASGAETQPEVFGEGALNFLDPQPGFVAKSAESFQSRDPDKPFCMCVTFNLPHGASCSTMQLRPGDDELYRSVYRDCFPRAALPAAWKPWKKSFRKLPEEIYNGIQIPDYSYTHTEQDLKERIIRQWQTVTGIDRFIGQLRSTLEKIGEADNTIIVYSSDHGLLWGEHGLGGKALLYEPALRIPLILYDPRPGSVSGQVCHSRVAVPDLAPTVLDLCGVEIPREMQGTSLRLAVEGESQTVRDTLFVENIFTKQNYPVCEGILKGNMKYIRYHRRVEDPETVADRLKNDARPYKDLRDVSLRPPDYEELFDLARDPEERHSLIGQLTQEERMDYRRCCDQAILSLKG